MKQWQSKVPGFAAEAALLKSPTRYASVGQRAGQQTPGKPVIPGMSREAYCMIRYESDAAAYNKCMGYE
jgi:hypothetical protein